MMAESSRSREQSDAMSATSGIIDAGTMEKIDIYLKLTMKCMEEVRGLSSQKFNNEQCCYLIDKLEVTIQSASLFVEGSQVQPNGHFTTMNFARDLKILKLLMALAKQVESFVRDCSKNAWMQSALTLVNVAEFVSSLGFNLELCRIALCNEQPTSRSLTIDEVGRISKNEVEIVEKVALRDMLSLRTNATSQLGSSNLEDQSLAKYLLYRIEGIQPISTSSNDNILSRLFDWVESKNSKQLGKGASATVYEVMWFGTPVAKKEFDGSENKEFLKEVEILSQLCHPNITSMFCCQMNRQRCSIIMELMDGDLQSMIRSRLNRDSDAPPFNILEAIDIMLQVGEGVNYLHKKRIVHRDLKSSNILIKNLEVLGSELGHMQAKVVDFGISKIKDKSIYENITSNTGTSRWMAPEIIKTNQGEQENSGESVKSQKHVFKVDIYSFAMVCFEILSGEVPFSGIEVPRLKEKVLKGERPIIPDNCPFILKLLIEECWRHDPSKRPNIGDVCLHLKHIKYLLMTSNEDQNRDNPLLMIEPFELIHLDIQNVPSVSQFQLSLYSDVLKEILLKFNGPKFIHGTDLFHMYGKLEKRSQDYATKVRAGGDVGNYKEKLKDINHLLYFMDMEYVETKIMYRSMEFERRATWQMLWAFFPCGEMVTYREEPRDKRVLGKVLQTYYEDTPVKGPTLFIKVMNEHEEFTNHTITVARFVGFCAFDKLDVYPVRFKRMPAITKPNINPIHKSRFGTLTKNEYFTAVKDRNPIKRNFLKYGKMPMSEMERCTENSIIAEGQFSLVYRVRLHGDREAVIKMAKLPTVQQNSEFCLQASLWSGLKHKNVVELMGYRADGEVKALAYEYASMGSLSDILHGKGGVESAEPRVVLDWMQRVKIAVDVAKGLEYLHERVSTRIIHQGIRSSNILLFDSCVAKIDSFKFWKSDPLMSKNILKAWKLELDEVNEIPYPLYYAPKHRIPYAKGFGPPEWKPQSKLTQKSDVYSFGVILLELLTGQKSWDSTLPFGQQNIVTRSMSRMRENTVLHLIDPKLGSNYPAQAAVKMKNIAASCLQHEPDSRPTMSFVVKALQRMLNTLFTTGE